MTELRHLGVEASYYSYQDNGKDQGNLSYEISRSYLEECIFEVSESGAWLQSGCTASPI